MTQWSGGSSLGSCWTPQVAQMKATITPNVALSGVELHGLADVVANRCAVEVLQSPHADVFRMSRRGLQEPELVPFVDAEPDDEPEIDSACAKYRRYAGRILNSVLSPEARSTTMRLVARSITSWHLCTLWYLLRRPRIHIRVAEE